MADKIWRVQFMENNGAVLQEKLTRKGGPDFLMTLASIDIMGWLRIYRGAALSVEQTEALLREWKKHHV